MPRSATFAPLAHRAFVLILAGSLLSNFGNAIESVGAAWQLTADGQPADVIALVPEAGGLGGTYTFASGEGNGTDFLP